MYLYISIYIYSKRRHFLFTHFYTYKAFQQNARCVKLYAAGGCHAVRKHTRTNHIEDIGTAPAAEPLLPSPPGRSAQETQRAPWLVAAGSDVSSHTRAHLSLKSSSDFMLPGAYVRSVRDEPLPFSQWYSGQDSWGPYACAGAYHEPHSFAAPPPALLFSGDHARR